MIGRQMNDPIKMYPILKIALVFMAVMTFSPRLVLGGSDQPIPLKQAKLIIEHNATDKDTGFQGFFDSEGWQRMTYTGPDGTVLSFEGQGALGTLGLTELFFETVEPENKEVPVKKMLAKLPAGKYTIKGLAMENGDQEGETVGTAWLTHNIPQGPVLLQPKADANVPLEALTVSWEPVTTSISGDPIKIIAYQLIIEKDEDPHPHMVGKRGLSMYLPASVTTITVPREFLESGQDYQWEVLAIEESGNQTLSSAEFRTR